MANSVHKTGLKSLSFLQVSDLSQQQAAQVVTFQARSQKLDLNEHDENQLFQKVLKFLEQFLTTKALQATMMEHLNKKRSTKNAGSGKHHQKMLSFKKMNMGSRVCFDGQVISKEEPLPKREEQRATRGNNKKISIFVVEEDYSSSSDEFSDDILSQNSVKTIRSIEVPHMEMNIETISMIYETPQPFLINLSLCLFIRYCLATKRKVKFQESAWVLCVATIIAYKLYYDEEIEGLMDCFMGVMKVPRKDLIDLERCFFQEIDYNTVIRNYDYHFVLSTLLSMPVPTPPL